MGGWVDGRIWKDCIIRRNTQIWREKEWLEPAWRQQSQLAWRWGQLKSIFGPISVLHYDLLGGRSWHKEAQDVTWFLAGGQMHRSANCCGSTFKYLKDCTHIQMSVSNKQGKKYSASHGRLPFFFWWPDALRIKGFNKREEYENILNKQGVDSSSYSRSLF